MSLIRLDIGELNGRPPREAILAALSDATRADGQGGRYTPPAGLPQCREAVARFLTRTTPVGGEQVTMTVGASGGLLAILLALQERSGPVLLPEPSYPGHFALMRALGLTVKTYPLVKPDWFIDLDALATLMASPVKALILTSPSNPTGAVFTSEQLSMYLHLAAQHGIPVIVDETYGDVALVPHTSALECDYDSLYVVRSFSKTFCLSGWRIGAVITSKARTETIARHHYAATMSAPTPSQHAVTAAVQAAEPYLAAQRRRLFEARALATEGLRTLGFEVHIPEGGPFLWLREQQGLSTENLTRLNVLTTPGSACGPQYSSYVRLNYDVDGELMDMVLSRLATTVVLP